MAKAKPKTRKSAVPAPVKQAIDKAKAARSASAAGPNLVPLDEVVARQRANAAMYRKLFGKPAKPARA